MAPRFPFDFNDILYLLSMPTLAHGKTSQDFQCEFCKDNGKHMNINVVKGVYRCTKCSSYGGILDFYGHVTGLERKDALHDIEEKLNLNTKAARRENYKKLEIEEKKHINHTVDINVMHKGNMALINSLSLKEKEYNMMFDRGLSRTFILAKQYRTYPEKYQELIDCANYLQTHGVDPKGIPGFYTEGNKWMLRKLKRGILIPVRDSYSRVQGFQLRKNNDLLKTFPKRDENQKIIRDAKGKVVMKKENKFVWLSSKDMLNGASTKAFVHYACDFKYDDDRKRILPIMKGKKVRITEGPMKADIFYYYTKLPMLAVPGVNALDCLSTELDELIALYQIDTVECYFDMDFVSNELVKKGLDNLEAMVKEKGLNFEHAKWDSNFKGCDDFVKHFYSQKMKKSTV